MSKHFCCCLPVRLGVFILSLLTLIGAAGTSFWCWWLIAWGPDKGIEFEKNYKIGFIVTGVVYAVFALVALFGFIGSVIRSRWLVRSFSLFLWLQLVLSLAISIFFSVALFRPSLRNLIVDECVQRLDELQRAAPDEVRGSNGNGLNRTTDQLRDDCGSVFNQSRVGFIIVFVVGFLINLYCCIIVHRYGNQLSEEQSYKASSHPLANTSHSKHASQASSSYYPHQPLGQHEMGQGYQYPYAQPQHGFGSK